MYSLILYFFLTLQFFDRLRLFDIHEEREDAQYGNTGCGVFKRGYIKLERFLPKNQHTQRKFWNFENWTNGEPQ